MSLTIPPAKNYASPLVALPSVWNKAPTEGSRVVPAEVDWATMGGPSNCVNFNIAALASQTISQICALSVDNSLCAADVTFVFPDTGQTYTVAAYEPQAVFPVFTNQTQFFLTSPLAVGADTTRFAILNFLPPPVALPLSVEQNSASVGGVTITGAGTTQIVPATTSGTIEALNIIAVVAQATSNFNDLFTLKDGTGKTIWNGNFAGNVGSFADATLISQSALSIRFVNGLTLTQAGGFTPGGTLSINIYFRNP